MCNFSTGIALKAMQEGLVQGREEGREEYSSNLRKLRTYLKKLESTKMLNM